MGRVITTSKAFNLERRKGVRCGIVGKQMITTNACGAKKE